MGLRPGYGIRLDSAQELLARYRPAGSVEANWPGGRVRLSAYLGGAELPTEIPGRVRCLVTDQDRVLVVWDRDGEAGILPGGGSEPGESVTDTAIREVLEETGWYLNQATVEVIGWIHLESLGAPTPDSPYPHPDSFMTVITATPSHGDPAHEGWVDVEGYVARSSFVAVSELPKGIRGDPISAAYLDYVLNRPGA